MVLLYPVTTEKAIGLIEKENKIIFVVEPKATRAEVRREVEGRFGVKVAKVNIMRSLDGKKKAYVKLTKDFKADDVAAKLKVA
ncbi:MAG: 50S ribosomal protein L23 [Candidatus ainarchaeum sp.]|nr:50S ribosomal protein L23 [Candidatus ainarchaeum sp.]